MYEEDNEIINRMNKSKFIKAELDENELRLYFKDEEEYIVYHTGDEDVLIIITQIEQKMDDERRVMIDMMQAKYGPYYKRTDKEKAQYDDEYVAAEEEIEKKYGHKFKEWV